MGWSVGLWEKWRVGIQQAFTAIGTDSSQALEGQGITTRMLDAGCDAGGLIQKGPAIAVTAKIAVQELVSERIK